MRLKLGCRVLMYRAQQPWQVAAFACMQLGAGGLQGTQQVSWFEQYIG